MKHAEAFELIKKTYPVLNRITLEEFLEFSSLIERPKKAILISEGKKHSIIATSGYPA